MATCTSKTAGLDRGTRCPTAVYCKRMSKNIPKRKFAKLTEMDMGEREKERERERERGRACVNVSFVLMRMPFRE